MSEERQFEALSRLLGAPAVVPRVAAQALGFGSDASLCPAEPFLATVFPSSIEMLVELVRWAEKGRIPLVPVGGRTGYSGGAVGTRGAVIVSLERMRRVLDFDPVGSSLSLEAGVVTADLKREAESRSLHFPLDFAAIDRSHVGGNVSTNAGGLRVLRYGTMHDLVLGLTVVTGRGAVLSREFGLRKSSSGPESWRLFVGAEGILGFVAEVEVRLVSPPDETAVVLLAVDRLESLLTISVRARQSRVALLSFEMFDAISLREVRAARGWPIPYESLPSSARFFGLVEAEVENVRDEAAFTRWLDAIAEEGCSVNDRVVARDRPSRESLWRYRRAISESLGERQRVHKNDLAVPLAKLPRLVEQIERLSSALPGGIEIALFGHVGDGNLHLNVLCPRGMEPQRFAEMCGELDRASYAVVAELGGAVSAEHGIGLLKRHALPLGRNGADLALLREVKRAFDPEGIFNPGKVIASS